VSTPETAGADRSNNTPNRERYPVGIFDKAGSAPSRDTSDRDPHYEVGDAGLSVAILVSGKLVAKTKNGHTIVPSIFANLLHQPESASGQPVTVGARRQWLWGPNLRKTQKAQAVLDQEFKNLSMILLGAPGSDERAAEAIEVLSAYLGKAESAEGLEGIRLTNRRNELVTDAMAKLWGGEGPSGQILEVHVRLRVSEEGKTFANANFRRLDAAQEAELREAIASGAYEVPTSVKDLVVRGPVRP
jgi:hypothetical protein